jgi:hypothetical protein
MIYFRPAKSFRPAGKISSTVSVMNEKREIAGIGYHYLEHGEDCLLVEQWARRPDDLQGQAVTIKKLLPREFRCAEVGHHGGDSGPPARKFKFRIIVEIDSAAGNNA